jgi:hypothetical protein
VGLIDIAGAAVGRVTGRLARRAAGWILVGVFALIALYQATVALHAYLEIQFGIVQAHLMIAGFYAVATLLLILVLWLSGRKSAKQAARPADESGLFQALSGMANAPRDMQIAMIIEAVMLGYSLSRPTKPKNDA